MHLHLYLCSICPTGSSYALPVVGQSASQIFKFRSSTHTAAHFVSHSASHDLCARYRVFWDLAPEKRSRGNPLTSGDTDSHFRMTSATVHPHTDLCEATHHCFLPFTQHSTWSDSPRVQTHALLLPGLVRAVHHGKYFRTSLKSMIVLLCFADGAVVEWKHAHSPDPTLMPVTLMCV